MARGYRYFFTVRNQETGDVFSGTSAECAAQMGLTINRFQKLSENYQRGTCKAYEITKVPLGYAPQGNPCGTKAACKNCRFPCQAWLDYFPISWDETTLALKKRLGISVRRLP